MAAVADRHLLFGLLALQNGLINQGQLVAAFQAWTLDKSRSLADHLESRGDLAAAKRALLEGLAAVHLEAHGGHIEQSLAAISAGKSTRESLARIGGPETEATLARVASGPGSTEDGDPDHTVAYALGAATSESQRFRVLRPHARGGLGAVFVALDAELNREVALKQILERHADDPSSRQRFLLEAEVTGGLEHPGIVPVYGLGTYADGRPYYAMRFVRGNSLKEAIDGFHSDDALKSDPGRRSLELRKLLRRFTDVCNAIDYAHSRGVLHRDIKPGNIIVGKHGETLVVDWGLAKATGKAEPGAGERTLRPGSASGSSETLPGSALGTPAYMSPEQARGEVEGLGPRTDVYSLGATLYCLLTGKPPLEGDDAFELVRKAQRAEFPRPRQHDSSIDPALEAVCLRAMVFEPSGRYATPRLLAEDLERWMADEPVTSWREPVSRRALRWLTRHRTGVTAAAAAVLVALAGTGAVLAVQTRANSRLKAANDDLAIANAHVTRVNGDLAASVQRERARFDLAMEAIRMFHSGVSEDLLLKQKEFGPLRTKLLGGAKDFYHKLEGMLREQTDQQSRLDLGKAYGEVAELTSQLGSLSDAVVIRRRALAIFEDLGKSRQNDPDLQVEVLRNRSDLVRLLWITGQKAEGSALVGPLLRLAEAQLDACDPSDLDRRFNLTKVLHEQGAFIAYNSQGKEGREVLHKVKASLEELVKSRPSSELYRLELVSACDSLAMALGEQGMHEEALATYERGRGLGEALFDADPGDAKIGQELLRTLGNLAIEIKTAGQADRAIAVYEQALKLIATTEAANPALRANTRNRAWIEANLANDLTQLDRDAEALVRFENARNARQRLVRADSSVLRDQEELVRILGGMAEIHLRAGRVAEARASLAAGEDVISGLAKTHADDLTLQTSHARHLGHLADFESKAGKASEALAWSDQALAIERGLLRDHPSEAPTLAGLLRRRGVILQKAGKAFPAAVAFREAIRLLEGMAHPGPDHLYDLACSQSLLSGIAPNARSGLSPDERLVEAEKAMNTLRRALAMGWRNPSHMNLDADLDPLRTRPDFQALASDLAFPVDPFAGPRDRAKTR